VTASLTVSPITQPGPGVVGSGQHAAKLARSVYSGRIAAYLREAIIGGEIPADTPLVEMRLAQQLSVSRGPIRSALHVLGGEGLVQTLPNGRTVSCGFERRDLADLFRVRYELESSAIGWAIAGRNDMAAVRAAFEGIVDEGGSTPHLVDLDVNFHRSLVESSGSRFLGQAWLAIAPVIQAVITIGNRELAAQDPASNFARIVDSHRLLCDAVVAYKPKAAAYMLVRQFELTSSMFEATRE
jgi:GntR family transcriptional regulator, gluconate operon transcriptional repressor